MPGQYKYRTLSRPTSIRLLHGCGLNQSPGRSFQEIDGTRVFGPEQYTAQEYSLQEANLDANPKFEALSYTWQSDPTKPTTSSQEVIRCDGHELAITQNLADALRRLSTVQRDAPIWIDAVCINQEDIAERNQQVNMMGRIYSSARAVVVWLGPTRVSDAEHMSVPQRRLQMMEALPQLAESSPADDHVDFRYAAGALKGFEITATTLVALAHVFDSPWFSRVWTIQEIMLANEVVVYSGPFEYPWKTMYNTALVVGALFNNIRPTGWLAAIDRKYVEGARLHVLMKRFGQPLRRRPLEFYFDLARSHGATDPRDKVFALLGLAEPEPRTEYLDADYSRTVQEVYLLCASYVLRGRTGLQLLSMVEDKSERSLTSLPSWVPDLSVAPKARRLRFREDAQREARIYEVIGTSLILEACSCAIVETVAEGIEDIMDELRPLSLLRMLSSHGAAYPTGERALHAICHALAAPVMGPQDIDADRLRKSFGRWVLLLFLKAIAWAEGYLGDRGHYLNRFLTEGSFLRRKSRDSLPKDWSESLHDALRTFGRVFAEDTAIDQEIASIKASLKESWETKEHEEISAKLRKPQDDFDSRFFTSYKGRRLFRTKEGFVGLGPESIRPGDQVFLLRDAHVPFILRSISSGVHELVGESYVHGFMEGQAYHGVREKMSKIKIM
ncbi:Heterokaryon incompatibility [Macrophomina phaseolina MS6]|uniref:Heterokaryon incompatibility n=1 Tax=Macrophomina phaseolina (strain MS6) TaxID=1126212 RepID=K2SCL3_MACPH|nr:Heterokaryon incompatibility [Macrophomina phaseolina MS6]